MIRVEHLTKVYGKKIILDDVGFTIDRGTVLAIIGPSGAGKSTLLRCINGLEKFNSGRIFINGEELTKNNVVEIRKKIGFVFQQFNLFPHMSVLENIVLPQVVVKKIKREKAEDIAYNILSRIGLIDKVDSYPSELSGGEQQRVAIARALALDPEIMLFDEPTSSLDPEMTREVLDLIRKLTTRKITMIIVSHEMGFIYEISDYVMFMDEGRVVEFAPTKTFFLSPKEERTKRFLSKVINISTR
jgi:ABC-type polar amino acid transport system ATPase subunit